VGIVNERRKNQRTEIEIGCRLSRRKGPAIAGRTVDMGPGGMCVTTERPLAADEVLEFELPDRPHFSGRARVLREQTYHVYALRFERLSDEARTQIDAMSVWS
jgi:PilZ domain